MESKIISTTFSTFNSKFNFSTNSEQSPEYKPSILKKEKVETETFNSYLNKYFDKDLDYAKSNGLLSKILINQKLTNKLKLKKQKFIDYYQHHVSKGKYKEKTKIQSDEHKEHLIETSNSEDEIENPFSIPIPSLNKILVNSASTSETINQSSYFNPATFAAPKPKMTIEKTINSKLIDMGFGSIDDEDVYMNENDNEDVHFSTAYSLYSKMKESLSYKNEIKYIE